MTSYNVYDPPYIETYTINKLLEEVKRGVDKYGDFENLEQFKEVLKEEVQETLDELNADTIDLVKVYAETLQVAAVAIRAIEEMERGTLNA